jgi:hypothetical protein
MKRDKKLEDRKMKELEYFIDHAVRDMKLKPAHMAVWLAIFHLSDQEGVTSIDDAELLRRSGIKSQRTLKNALQYLIDLDLIKPVTSGNCKESQWICLPLKKE